MGSEVSQYKDASGSNPYMELAEFLTSLLLQFHSNAQIERTQNRTKNTTAETQTYRKKKSLKVIDITL